MEEESWNNRRAVDPQRASYIQLKKTEKRRCKYSEQLAN